LSDELRLRAETHAGIGLNLLAPHQGKLEDAGMVLLVESRATRKALSRAAQCVAEITGDRRPPQAALFERRQTYELVNRFLVSGRLRSFAGSFSAALARTPPDLSELVVAEQGEEELGDPRRLSLVSDYLLAAVEIPMSLLARKCTQFAASAIPTKVCVQASRNRVEFAVNRCAHRA